MRVMGILIFLFLLFSTNAIAANLLSVDCEDYGASDEECLQIKNDPNLTDSEKKDLISELIVGGSKKPNHTKIYDWDKGINVSIPPAGVAKSSEGILKDGWVKIRGIYPSVYNSSEIKWYIEKGSKVIADYDYGIQLPTGTASGDCETRYSYDGVDEGLSIIANGLVFGTVANEAAFEAKEGTNNISAKLQLSTVLTTSHYRLKQHCDVDEEGQTFCWQTCDFSSADTRTDTLNLEDSLGAIRKDYDYDIQLRYEKKAGLDELAIMLKINQPLNEFIIDFNGPKFALSEYDYSIKRNNSPYEHLYVEGERDFSKPKKDLVELDFEKIKILEDYIYTIKLGLDKVPETCKMRIYTNFGELNLDDKCVFLELKDSQISIGTDKKDYGFDEAIKISATLRDKYDEPIPNRKIMINYGSTSEDRYTDLEGKAGNTIDAEKTFGTIEAKFEGDTSYAASSATARVILREKADWDLTVLVLGYFAVNYILFLLLKKYTRGNI